MPRRIERATRIRTQLSLEQLEQREVPAVVWSGAAGNNLWTDGGNWVGGLMPTEPDDAHIDVPGTVTVTIDANVSVRSIISAENITVSAGQTLAVTGAGAASSISGSLTVTGAALAANGSGATFTVTGSTSADGASFLATGGATLSLPALTGQVSGRGTWGAEGADSVLEMRNLNAVEVSTGNLRIAASNGGFVNLQTLSSVSAVIGAIQWAGVSSDGLGSVVDLTALTSFTDAGNGGDHRSFLSATSGGELRAPGLNTLQADLNLDATGVMPVAQITSLKAGVVTLTGVSRTFSSLTDGSGSTFAAAGSVVPGLPVLSVADGTSFLVSGGATLALPALTTYSGAGFTGATWWAEGAGSVLDVRNLTVLPVQGYSSHWVEAAGGGVIDLRALQTATVDLFGDARLGISASGAGSLVDLTALTSFVSLSTFPGSPLTATDHGELRAPNLTTIQGNLILDAAGVMPVAQITSLKAGVVTLTGVSRTFSSLADGSGSTFAAAGSVVPGLPVLSVADGTSFLVSGGATLTLPALTRIDSAYGTWRADGAGSILDLRLLAEVGAVNGGLRVEASGGGLVDLRAVPTLAAPNGDNRWAGVSADGAGSVVDLSALTESTDEGAYNGTSYVQAVNAGELFAPSLTTLRANLTLDATGVLVLAPSLSIADGVFSSLREYVVASGGSFRFTGQSNLLSARIASAELLDVPVPRLDFGAGGLPGVLTNSVGGTLRFRGNGELRVAEANAGHAVVNHGFLERFGPGITRIDVPLVNTGTVTLSEGGLNLNGGGRLGFDGSNALRTLAGTTLRTTAPVTGSTTNADLFSSLGTVTLAGGTIDDPLRFEVMGADRGANGSGYARNFAYATIRLENAYVRLVDEFNNAAGGEAEVLYVDRLVVPAGSTLDLNGLKVYARQLEVQGTVIGGAVTPVPDGGSLTLNAPTFGWIANPGDANDYSFFGRSGQRVSVTVDPGSAGNPAPHLDFVEVQILSASGVVLASASNVTAGQPVTITVDALPADGTYTIRVKAPAANPNATGNYLLTGFNASIDVSSLVLNQQSTGLLETSRSLDRWTFSGQANQQVRLDLIGLGFLGGRFTLTGPNGWVGFSDLSDSSGLVTLPEAGTYQLEVRSADDSFGYYSFVLEQTTQTPLPLGTDFNGVVTGPRFVQLFKLDIAQETPLNVVLTSAAAAGMQVYLRRGAAPTRQAFDFQSATFGETQSILAPLVTPGEWFVLVYAHNVLPGSEFTLRADPVGVVVSSVTPGVGVTNQNSQLTITGAGFLPGAVVQLVSAGGVPLTAQSVSIDSTTRITATFNLNGVAAGSYGLRVSIPGGATATRPNAFTVQPAGQPNLVARLILPPDLGRDAPATLYVEYANTGNAAMAAPVLTLRSADPDGSDRPLLTLDQSRVVGGIWSAATLPDGVSTSVQMYASGATPGILLPGERVQVPVYYVGLQQPWTLTDTLVELEIRISRAEDSTAIDWNALLPTLRPVWISQEAWAAVGANLRAQVGNTWGEYIQMLGQNAAYLARLGRSVSDVSELYGFEVMQAMGISPIGTVASATDAGIPTPGLGLSFGRSYATNIVERYDVGPFGRGWSGSWQTRLATDANGVVVITDGDGNQRRFQPDVRNPNRYLASPSDTGILRGQSNGAFELTEATGEKTRFRGDGTIHYLEDLNGNRVTTEYAAGRLARLTHSNGAFLDIAYNAAGRISTITDSAGRVTTYGYDPTNNYLLTVATVGGTTAYTYDTTGSPQTRHALTSVTDASGVTETFQYDSRGRLQQTFLEAGINRFTFAYDTAFTITTTDPAGAAYSLFIDNRGQVGRQTSADGYYVNYAYDDRGRLTQATDATGRTQAFTWTPAGILASATDPLGHTSRFQPSGLFGRPAAFIDANGNTTGYGYDSDGNLTSTTYADGSVERVAYDATGNPTQLTNRRGDAIRMQYNAAGQLTREDFPDGTAHIYTYDARGRLRTATDPRGTTTISYDDATDRVTRIDYPQGRWLEYLYDDAGRRRRMTDQTGAETRYVYDAAGRLFELRDAANAFLVRYTYDASGRLERQDKGNGTYTLTTYDALSRIDTITHHAPGGAVNSRFDYNYDLLGRRTGMETIDGTWTYTYDLTGQLTRAVFASTNPSIPNQDLNYVYDALGNRVRTVLNGTTTDYAANNLNQYTSAGGTTYQYDRDGNLIRENGPGGVTTYTYNAQNQLVRRATPTTTYEYEYDALGNRTAVTENGVRREAVWDPFGMSDLRAEYAANGSLLSTFAHGIGLETVSTGAGTFYYEFEAIGSTATMTNGTGAVVNRYAYEPFGGSLLRQEGVANNHEFIGAWGVTDAGGGLNHMRARYYDSAAGRFVAMDPIRLEGGIHLYLYASNNPVTINDPAGLSPYRVIGHALIFLNDYLLGKWLDTHIWPRLEEWWNAPPPPPEFGPGGPGSGGYPGEPYNIYFERTTGVPPEGPGGPGPGGSANTRTFGDPNEKLGAVGVGPQAFIAPGSTIPYRINFENFGPGTQPPTMQPATAPAQRVVITDILPTELDWDTFQFTEFGWGDTLVTVPAGSTSVFQQVPVTIDGRSFVVEVEMEFDRTTGEVRVMFQSLDPATGLPPDVLTGFLIPEDGTGRGKGHIGYTVRARADLPTGTQIRNIATIVFGRLDPIDTNQVDPLDPSKGTSPDREALNTIDAGRPTASANTLPTTTAGPNVVVSWAGSDDAGGSGIATYDVYVSTNGGAFSLWLDNTPATSGTFTGVVGNSYSFFVVATDRVGNEQLLPGAAQAGTTLVPLPPPPVVPPVVPPTTPSPGLVGYREFGVGADRGGGATVTLFNPDLSARQSQIAFPGWQGGVRTIAADVTGDGVADLIVGTGPGGPTQVRIFDGVTGGEVFAVAPFEAAFTGGVFLAAGDIDRDGVADLVISPDEGGGPRVRVFRGAGFTLLADFFGIDDPNFRGGARAGIGDLNGDGYADLLVSAGFGGGPRVAGFDGRSLADGRQVKLFPDFFVFEDRLRNGMYVTAGDFDGDGYADLVAGAGPGGGPRVFILDGADVLAGRNTNSGVLANFFAGNPENRGGVRVAVKNLDDDTRADLLVGDGTGGGNRVTGYLGRSLTTEAFAFDAYPGFAGGVFVG